MSSTRLLINWFLTEKKLVHGTSDRLLSALRAASGAAPEWRRLEVHSPFVVYHPFIHRLHSFGKAFAIGLVV